MGRDGADWTRPGGSVSGDTAPSPSRRAPPRPVGELLRGWRRRRGLSQLGLALAAEVSARHISFVENGRAMPSREMLLQLASVMDIPLRERNRLLLAAGYGAIYHQTDLAAPEMMEVRHALEFVLTHYEPNPTLVMDRSWNVLTANGAATLLLAFVRDPSALASLGPPNAVRLVMHPAGMRPCIANWDEVAAHLLGRLHREASFGLGDHTAAELLQEVLGYPDVPHRLRARDHDRPDAPALPLVLIRGGETLSFFTTVTTFGTPLDVTLQELRIETYFPADESTRKALRRAGRDVSPRPMTAADPAP
jgi:transcriptional regulator with XRE-family HTH domain